jgi:hypothetical protein
MKVSGWTKAVPMCLRPGMCTAHSGEDVTPDCADSER